MFKMFLRRFSFFFDLDFDWVKLFVRLWSIIFSCLDLMNAWSGRDNEVSFCSWDSRLETKKTLFCQNFQSFNEHNLLRLNIHDLSINFCFEIDVTNKRFKRDDSFFCKECIWRIYFDLCQSSFIRKNHWTTLRIVEVIRKRIIMSESKYTWRASE